jgi:hypothetical protein
VGSVGSKVGGVSASQDELVAICEAHGDFAFEDVEEALAGAAKEVLRSSAFLVDGEARHHVLLQIGCEEEDVKRFGGRVEFGVVASTDDMPLNLGLLGKQFAYIDPVEAGESQQPPDRNVAFAILDVGDERWRNARRHGNVGERVAVFSAERS